MVCLQGSQTTDFGSDLALLFIPAQPAGEDSGKWLPGLPRDSALAGGHLPRISRDCQSLIG